MRCSTVETCILTFTAAGRNLSERVVAAVALAADHAGFTLTLAAFAIARSGEGADGVTVTEQAGVAALWAIVVVLKKKRGEMSMYAPYWLLDYITRNNQILLL